MLMDTRQLAAFCAVVERASFSHAAEQLGVTQPAVSLQIRSLEKRLGRQLLDRSGRRVEPTEAGQRLYRSALRLLAQEEQLLADLGEEAEGELAGRLEIGGSTGPGGTVLPVVLAEFQQRHPGVHVALTVSDTQRIIEQVARRELELGVVGAARRHRGVVFEPFFRDEVVLAVPRGHRFAGHSVSLDELKAEPLVLMQEGAGVRQVIDDELLLVASPRWDLPVAAHARWSEVPSERIDDASAQARGGVIALGGGSAIDLGKAISAAAGVPLVSVPTTYAGAEWTTYYGVRDPERKLRGGGAGAEPRGIVYEPDLTFDLPRETTVGTAMNALAHCAEALYVDGHNEEADAHALTGAQLIAAWLPRVVDAPRDREARTELLRGACHGGAALGGSGLALAHAMAQAVGGRYGLPHGTLNGICLPPALRWNEQWAPDAVRRFREAVGRDVEELAALGGKTRLGELGVPEDDLAELAEAAADRPGNRANPRPATPAEIEALLRAVF